MHKNQFIDLGFHADSPDGVGEWYIKDLGHGKCIIVYALPFPDDDGILQLPDLHGPYRIELRLGNGTNLVLTVDVEGIDATGHLPKILATIGLNS